MQQIYKEDLELLALGSAVLGSGGGGDPAYDLLMAQYAMDQYGPVKLIRVEDLAPDDLIAPCDFIGAPLVAVEQLPQGEELLRILELIRKTLGKSVTALLPSEIGGGNAFVPLTIASRLGLPVVDGDLIGRAFPQIQMCTAHLTGISPTPAFLADGLGNSVVVHANTSMELEKIARQVAIAMGSHCAMASFLMNGNQAKQAVIPGSISKACKIGAVMKGNDPIQSLVNSYHGAVLAEGMVTEINQDIRDGFLEGTVKMGTPQGTVEIIYQNEYLVAKVQDSILASTPDIITLLESDSGTPITSESLKYGLRVHLIALPAPKIWTTTEGLQCVGPHYFGFDFSYSPVKQGGHHEFL